MTSRVLHTGEFYGHVVREVKCAGFALTELGHPCGRVLPIHAHESAYFNLLLQGEYSERIGSKELPFDVFTSAFHPPQVDQRDQIGKSGARLFTLEVEEAALERLREIVSGPKLAPEVCNSRIRWMLSRLYFMYREADGEALLGIEELSLELLATVARAKQWKEVHRPKWLASAEEFLRAEIHRNVKLEEVAEAAGVHPIYLSRVFRRVQRQSLAAYVNQVRVQKASERMKLDATPLATIAADFGFADQSHFTRVFKKITGTTPAEFRRLLQPLGNADQP
jgi:AraC family transcriptional regulator